MEILLEHKSRCSPNLLSRHLDGIARAVESSPREWRGSYPPSGHVKTGIPGFTPSTDTSPNRVEFALWSEHIMAAVDPPSNRRES
jgi:hypothetical protein